MVSNNCSNESLGESPGSAAAEAQIRSKVAGSGRRGGSRATGAWGAEGQPESATGSGRRRFGGDRSSGAEGRDLGHAVGVVKLKAEELGAGVAALGARTRGIGGGTN